MRSFAALAILASLSSSLSAATKAFRDCAECPLMVVVPAGSFVMGSPDSEPGHQPAESPQHRVTIKRAFAIGAYDVTRREFEAFARDRGYKTDQTPCDWMSPKVRGAPINQSEIDPVVCVSWSDAHAYAGWLSRKSGHQYRLPSEAEWEYAARAGSTGPRSWRESNSRSFANYGSDQCCSAYAAGRDRWLFTSPVGSFPPNAFGLYDMLGNVWQRTEDCGHENFSGAPVDGSAWTKGGDCATRIVRGGAWFSPLSELRLASRAADPADFRKNDIGFRVVRAD